MSCCPGSTPPGRARVWLVDRLASRWGVRGFIGGSELTPERRHVGRFPTHESRVGLQALIGTAAVGHRCPNLVRRSGGPGAAGRWWGRRVARRRGWITRRRGRAARRRRRRRRVTAVAGGVWTDVFRGERPPGHGSGGVLVGTDVLR